MTSLYPGLLPLVLASITGDWLIVLALWHAEQYLVISGATSAAKPNDVFVVPHNAFDDELVDELLDVELLDELLDELLE